MLDIIDSNFPMIVNPQYPTYPPYHVGDYIEEYYFKYQQRNKIISKREYLPISWTTLIDHTMGGYNYVQYYLLNKINFSKHYYAVVMGDYVPYKMKIPPNTKVFSCAGYKGNDVVTIPVACSSLNEQRINYNKKNVFASFIGSNTNIYREKLMKYIEKDQRIIGKLKSWSVEVKKNEFEMYRDVSKQSKFVLCPRGNAPTSYRIYEAMQWSAIPIIFSDVIDHPMKEKIDWNRLCLIADETNIEKVIEEAYNMKEDEWTDRMNYIWEIYPKYFTQEGVCNYIAEVLKNESLN